MSNQLQITGGGKVRNLEGVITGTSGVLSSVPLGAANGVATLDSGGKVPVSQLPSSVVTYLGTWNAATNTPTLVNGTGDAGDMYICNVAGTVNFGAGPVVFVVGDWVLYGSGTWQKSSGQNGTVTSVGLSTNAGAITIGNSPISTSGTITANFNGTNLQYVNGAGNLTTFPTLTGYVPYTGATTNVDLGEYELKAGQLTLDVSPTGTATVGTTRWNNTIGSSETTLKGGTVILKNGVDLVARVVNKVTPNTTLTKAAYSAVRVSGAAGQRLAVAYAQANNDNNSADTIGLVIETIATNQEGFIMTVGQLLDINTTGSLQSETWVDGDVLYLSPTVAGALTNIKPTGATGHIVVMGYVEYAHAVHGSIYVKVMNGWELDELHNVYIVSPLNNQGLFYNSSNSLWENKSIATALGYTPANDALVVHLAGTETITGAKTFSGLTSFTSTVDITSGLTFSNSGFTLLLQPPTLSVNRTVTFADITGTIAMLEGTQTFSGVKTFTNNITVNSITIGKGAGTGTLNTAIGNLSLQQNTTGYGNTSIGYNALGNNTTGFFNAAIGVNALLFNSTGTYNNALGTASLYNNTTGSNNTAIGQQSGTDNTTGSNNTYVGYLSGYGITTGSNNTIIGNFTGTAAMANNIVLADGAGNVKYRYDGTNNNLYGNVNFSSTIGNGTYTYTLPSATGTVALTSQLGSYLPLAGGIMTGSLLLNNNIPIQGQLFGTSSYATMMIMSPSNKILIDGAGLGVIFGGTIGQGAYTYTFPAATGTIALTSQLTGGTVTSVAALTIGTTGTDLSSSVANSTTTPVITLNVPTASATNRGALSSADWTTFNNKQSALTNPVTGTGTTNYLPKFTGTSTIGNSNLINDASGNLGLGVTPSATAGAVKSINIGAQGYAFSDGLSYLYNSGFANNAYVNGNGSYAAIVSRPAGIFEINESSFIWKQASSGTAGSTLSLTSAMTLFANGNLAVGTTTDAGYKLDVNGTGRFGSDSVNGDVIIQSNATPLIIRGRSPYQAAGLALTWDITPNIGLIVAPSLGFNTNATLGTTVGTRALTLASTGAATFSSSVTLVNDLTINAALTPIVFLNTTSTNKASGFVTQESGTNKWGIGSNFGSADGTFNLYNYGAAARYLTIATTGAATFSSSVTATQGKFSGSRPQGIFTENGTSGLYLRDATGTGYKSWSIGTNDIVVGFAITPSTAVGGTTFTTPSFVINESGRVGIGQTSPGVALSVAGQSEAWQIAFTTATGTAGALIGSPSANVLAFGDWSGAERMRITSGGDLCIGTTSSSGYQLRMTGYAYIGGNIVVVGDATAAGFYESSDSRLKTLIQDNYQTKGIASITPKLYTKNGKVELGYYAQDFVGILDSAVSKGSDDMLSLSYREVLVAKVYALEQRIKELENK